MEDVDLGDTTVLHTPLSTTEIWFGPDEEDEGPGTSLVLSLVRSSSWSRLWVSVSSFSLVLQRSGSLAPT